MEMFVDKRGEAVSVTCRPLIEVLAELSDPRDDRGKRHPLPAILALACAGMLCGYRTYGAIAEWGRNYGQSLVQALGFTRERTPCAGTLHTVLCRLDRVELEARLGEWAEGVMASTPDSGAAGREAIAIDGKALRGSRRQGAAGAHLLSALSHRLGLTLAQCGVEDKTNEIPAITEILRGLVLEGRVITMDALHTQRETARAILEGGGDYVMIVKGNQPRMLADIELIFQTGQIRAEERRAVAETVDVGHGRIEHRRLTASSELAGYSDWPGMAQVLRIERSAIIKKTGEVRDEVVYGVTSLPPDEADPHRLMDFVRCHWHIENRSHWVRDVTFDEDRSQVRCGSIPEVMAALRNAAIGLMRWAGEDNIAAACRRFAAQPWSALALLGIPTDN